MKQHVLAVLADGKWHCRSKLEDALRERGVWFIHWRLPDVLLWLMVEGLVECRTDTRGRKAWDIFKIVGYP